MDWDVCIKCDVPHIENCPTCFGFGIAKIKDGEIIPVIAAEAMGDEPIPEWIPCHTCGSTPKGIKGISTATDATTKKDNAR